MAENLSTSASATPFSPKARHTTLEDLFLEELGIIHDAESQLLHALPVLGRAATHPLLKALFTDHLEPTRLHAVRIEWIFDGFSEPLRDRTCHSLAGLLAEATEWIASDSDPAVLDAGLVAKVLRIEHHEIAVYTCARTYARLLGSKAAEELLEATLREEAVASVQLNQLATDLNLEANLFEPRI